MPTIENKENIFALGQNVLVEMIEEKEQNEAGIIARINAALEEEVADVG